MTIRLISFLILIVCQVLPLNSVGGCIMTYGPMHQSSSGMCLAAPEGVGASYSPIVMIGLMIWVGWFICISRIRRSAASDLPVGLLRRVAAFFIDFWAILSFVVSVDIIYYLTFEAMRTREFAWSFHREWSDSADLVASLTYMPFFVWLVFYYFYKHMERGVPTIGQYILGYCLTLPKTDQPKILVFKNVFNAFLGLVIWPITLYKALKRSDRTVWWELNSGVRSCRVT